MVDYTSKMKDVDRSFVAAWNATTHAERGGHNVGLGII